MEQQKCVVCQSSEYRVVCAEYPGYVEGSYFPIFKCSDCGSHYIIYEDGTADLYEVIYSAGTAYGYERYLRYMQEIKGKKNPLRFLAYEESVYYPVYRYLKDKKDLRILEAGCGYGYLTYAIRHAGFDAFGLDISSYAIKAARENFGEHYFNNDINSFAGLNSDKFDLIIATELIEHLSDPGSFIEDCKKLLKDDGKILLTTPNKDYFSMDSIWMTDLPPVHITWIGKKGMEKLAEKCRMKPLFSDFSRYYSKSENRLIRYFRTRHEPEGSPALTKEGTAIDKVSFKQSFFHKTVVFCLHRIPFVRISSNFIHNVFINKEATLGVVLEK